MKKTNTHIVPHGNMWAVKKEGSKRASKLFGNRAEALKYAHNSALKDDTCFFVHDKEGKVGNVRCPRKEIPAILREFQRKYELS